MHRRRQDFILFVLYKFQFTTRLNTDDTCVRNLIRRIIAAQRGTLNKNITIKQSLFITPVWRYVKNIRLAGYSDFQDDNSGVSGCCQVAVGSVHPGLHLQQRVSFTDSAPTFWLKFPIFVVTGMGQTSLPSFPGGEPKPMLVAMVFASFSCCHCVDMLKDFSVLVNILWLKPRQMLQKYEILIRMNHLITFLILFLE